MPSYFLDQTGDPILDQERFPILLGLDDSPTPTVSAYLVWSLPQDQNAGYAAAVRAIRQRVRVGEETDVRLVFDPAGPAAEADDLTARTLEVEVAVDLEKNPNLILTEGNGITILSESRFEVAFTVTSGNGLSPETMLLSVYDVGTGHRTWLANVLVTATDTALKP